ncbi:MAG: TlpA family protein disulfide reductase [Burkholderiales bacterium]
MEKKFRDKALIAAIALSALLAGYFAYSLPTKAPKLTDLLATNFYDLHGKDAKISDWPAKLRVVNFWATWCPPCREEIPGFIRLQEKYRDQGLVFIGVALDNNEQVKRFADETRMNYPILLGKFEAMELARDAGNSSGTLPFTVLIKEDGSLARAFSGAVNEHDFEAIIKRFL